MRKLEALFCVFIGIMGLSFAWMFGETNPDVKAMASGVYLTLLFVTSSFKHFLSAIHVFSTSCMWNCILLWLSSCLVQVLCSPPYLELP